MSFDMSYSKLNAFKCKTVQIDAVHNKSLFLKTTGTEQMNEWEVTETQVCVCVCVRDRLYFSPYMIKG